MNPFNRLILYFHLAVLMSPCNIAAQIRFSVNETLPPPGYILNDIQMPGVKACSTWAKYYDEEDGNTDFFLFRIDWYTPEGLFEKFQSFDEKGAKMLTNHCFYDTLGRHIYSYSIRPDGFRREWRASYEVDSAGRISTITVIGEEDTVRHSFWWHEDGKFTVYQKLDGRVLFHNEYDASGRGLSEYFAGTGNSYLYSLDSCGNVTYVREQYAPHHPDEEGLHNVKHYKNEYDAAGNLVRRLHNGYWDFECTYGMRNELLTKKSYIGVHNELQSEYKYKWEWY